MEFQVEVDVLEDAFEAPDSWRVVRRQDAPEMPGPLHLTDWIDCPSVVLDIDGWPTRLVDDTDCAVRVTWVEPMPPGSDCGDPMPVEGLRWTTLRTKFR